MRAVASVRLALRDDVTDRKRVPPKRNARVDPATQAVAQRKSVRTLSNRLQLEEGEVVTLLEAVDDDWTLGECGGRRGRFPRTALYDIYELTFAAQWHGCPLAQWDLGWRHLEGWSGLRRDDARGAGWIQRAAAQHHTPSVYSLSGLLGHGRGVPRNEAESRRLLEECAERGLAFAHYDLMIFKQRYQPNEVAAFPHALAAAEQGLFAAVQLVIHCYEEGRGVERSEERAAHWRRVAEESGDAGRGMHLLGIRFIQECNHQGTGVEWLAKAVAANHLPSYLELGRYLLQNNWHKDVPRGVALLTHAAEHGSEDAMLELGRQCSASGQLEEALKWYDACGERGRTSIYQRLLFRVFPELSPELEKLP